MQEVEVAVNQMAEGKVSSPDCFTINFLHHCWDFLKFEVLEIVEDSSQNKWVLSALNTTHITLVPKET